MTWTIHSNKQTVNDLLTEESLYFTGNGYIGVRGNFEEGYQEGARTIRGTYINAFHDITDISYGEKLHAFPETQQKLLNIIDVQTIRLALVEGEDEQRLSIFNPNVTILDYQRNLHLDQGYTSRSIHFQTKRGNEVRVTYKRLASFTHLETFVQEVTVEPVKGAVTIKVLSTVNGDVSNFVDPNDPRVASGHAKRLHVTNVNVKDDLAVVEVETEVSKLRAAAATAHYFHPSVSVVQTVSEQAVETSAQLEVDAMQTITKITVFTDTLRHGKKVSESAVQLQQTNELTSFADWLARQSEYLQHFWQAADIQIEGEASLQEGIRFNIYHLLQSAGRDRYSNIAAKGLSGEGYEGHYFWDTEIYMVPVFLLTRPELAKQLLIYRHSILNGARQRAKEMGHRQGALFPWRTIAGSESSAYFPAGTAQYHISADVAYSYIQYYLATGDEEFLQTYGAEVLIETARLWVDTGHYHEGKFKIDAVTGPDEYTCIVNNNYYTNVMAKHNLKWASKVYLHLKEQAHEAWTQLTETLSVQASEVDAWEQAAEQMYLPYDEELDINPQDDTFLQKAVWDFEQTPKDHYPLLLHYHPLTLYRYQVCKQADTVLAHFLLEDEQAFSTIQHSLAYYEKITTHDSSLSSCVHSIMAAKVGEVDKAYEYFIETARLDLDNTHGNTKDGLHMANMGGTWMAIVFGFAGVRIKETGLYLKPVLPEAWRGYSFNITYRQSQVRVEVSPQQVVISLLNGSSVTLDLYGEKIAISPSENIAVPVQ